MFASGVLYESLPLEGIEALSRRYPFIAAAVSR